MIKEVKFEENNNIKCGMKMKRLNIRFEDSTAAHVLNAHDH